MHEVGWLAALPLVGIGLGVFIGGFWSDRLIRRIGPRRGRRRPGMIGLPLAALAILFAIATPSAYAAAVALSLGAGLAALAVAPAWATCLDIGGRHAGVVTGAMNTFGNLGGTVSPLVVGLWLQRHPGSWNGPLVTVALCYAVAAVCWLAIDADQAIPGTA
jgi:MFS family permease